MEMQPNSLMYLEKMLLFFGTVSTFLLGIIAFFLKRFIDEHDTTKTIVASHETRISVAETDIKNIKEAI